MSDNIYENRMFCVGDAWHIKGTRIEKEVNSKEAIELAHLNYIVEKVPVFAKRGDINIDSDYYATVNSINNKILGIVTDRYKVIQNIDAFDFFDNIVETGDAIYHSAGALGNGERIWLLAKLPKDILIFRDDIVEKYLLLTNSHDGKSSLLMYFTPIRVVCQNTLNASYKNAKDGISIRHMGNIQNKVEEARMTLGLALNFYVDFENDAKAMLDTKLTKDDGEKYFSRVLNIGNKQPKDISTQAKNALDKMLYLLVKGRGNVNVRDTLWAGYNAVTEYADHYKTVRGNNRINSILFGSGAELKRKAYDEALILINK